MVSRARDNRRTHTHTQTLQCVQKLYFKGHSQQHNTIITKNKTKQNVIFNSIIILSLFFLQIFISILNTFYMLIQNNQSLLNTFIILICSTQPVYIQRINGIRIWILIFCCLSVSMWHFSLAHNAHKNTNHPIPSHHQNGKRKKMKTFFALRKPFNCNTTEDNDTQNTTIFSCEQFLRALFFCSFFCSFFYVICWWVLFTWNYRQYYLCSRI